MANPLAAFQNLKTWQKGAIAIGGGLAVVGVVLYERKAKASAAATASATPASAASTTASTASTAGDMVTDPTTGESYPADSVDEASGLTYGTEIQEYGSVAAADEAASEAGDAAIEDGQTQTEYDETTGYTGSTSPAPVTTNEQWMSEVETGLATQGYSQADVGEALAALFSSSKLGITSDGTSESTIVNLAISEFGPPPEGSYPILPGSGSTGLPGTGNAVVPDVVGRTDLSTAESVITAAGLVPHAAGDSAVGNKGTVTSQSPAANSTVTKGSGVTLTYTISAANEVAVPNVVGRTDLDTAKSAITAAGLKATASAASTTASKGNKGRVSAQSPKAGTRVAKGSTVTLTYTK